MHLRETVSDPKLEECPKCHRKSQGFGQFYYCSDKPQCLHVSMFCAYQDCHVHWRNEEVTPETEDEPCQDSELKAST